MTDKHFSELFSPAAFAEMLARLGVSADLMLAELKRRDAEAAVAAAPTEPDPGEGYRWVEKADVVCRGDECKSPVDGEWRTVQDVIWAGVKAGERYRFRRRIEPVAPPAADAAVGPGNTEAERWPNGVMGDAAAAVIDRHYDASGDEIPAEAVPSLLQAEIARLTAKVERLRAARTALTRALRVFLFEITSPTTDQSHEVRQAIADALRDHGGTT